MKITQRKMSRPSLGGLMATRQGALLLAVLCAACAAGILVFALGRYRTSLKTQTTQATVLVATGEIPKGTSGSEVAARALYKSMPIVASQMAPGAVSDASLLTGKIASADILPGQQLTLADFTGVTGVSGLLTPDQRAISLAITEAPGDNDVLQAGDHVDVYAAFKQGDTSIVVLLDPNTPVVKSANSSTSAGPTSSKAGTGGATGVSGASLVLAVTSKEASDLVYAAENGTLYLSVRPTNGTTSPRNLTTLSSVIRDSVATVTPGG